MKCYYCACHHLIQFFKENTLSSSILDIFSFLILYRVKFHSLLTFKRLQVKIKKTQHTSCINPSPDTTTIPSYLLKSSLKANSFAWPQHSEMICANLTSKCNIFRTIKTILKSLNSFKKRTCKFCLFLVVYFYLWTSCTTHCTCII